MPPPQPPPPLNQRWFRKKAKERLIDAEALLQQGRYEGSWYLCGYAMEYYLKARICTTMQWGFYPVDGLTHDGKKAFQTHDLGILLKLSGRMKRVANKPAFVGNWSVVVKWKPEDRYKTGQVVTVKDATDMIAATKALMRLL